MAFVPAPNCAEVHVRGSQSGWQCEWTIGAKYIGAYDQSNLDELASDVDAFMAELGLAAMTANALYTETYVRGLTTSVDLESTNTDSAGAGTSETGGTPAQASAVISKLTGHTGRSARGRLYWFGLPNGYRLDERHLTTDAVAEFDALGAGLKAAIEAHSWTPVVISRQNDGVHLSTAAAYPITDMLCRSNRIDTQRRRVGKYGS